MTPWPVEIEVGGLTLEGDLELPPAARGLVILAPGAGSRSVHQSLQGMATLRMGLLSIEEQLFDLRTRQLRFDVDLLARRLRRAAEWAARTPATSHLALGLFGAEMASPAVIRAAAALGGQVAAVVVRCRAADLGGSEEELASLRVPTLQLAHEDPALARGWFRRYLL